VHYKELHDQVNKKNATRLVNVVKLWSNVNKVSDFLVSELLLV